MIIDNRPVQGQCTWLVIELPVWVITTGMTVHLLTTGCQYSSESWTESDLQDPAGS